MLCEVRHKIFLIFCCDCEIFQKHPPIRSKIKLIFSSKPMFRVYQNYLVVTLKRRCIMDQCSASNKTFMNINARAEKCSSQSHYSHYGFHTIDVIKAVDSAHTGMLPSVTRPFSNFCV